MSGDKVSFSLATWMVSYADDDRWRLLSFGTVLSQLQPLGSYDSYKHYYPAARQEYFRWHTDAVQLAVGLESGVRHHSAASEASAQQALLFEAFAVHYLVDLFWADHAAPPIQRVHTAVTTRNRSALARAGLKAADARWYFGDDYATPVQRDSIVKAISKSVEEVVLASNETLTTRAELKVPFFGWNTASEEKVRTGRRSEYFAISFNSRSSGSGVRYAQAGLRLDVWLCRFFSIALAGYPIYRETRFGEFDSDISMSLRPPRVVTTGSLRLPLFSVRELIGVDGDFVVDSSLLCDTDGSLACHALPEFGGGPDRFSIVPPGRWPSCGL